MAVFLVLNAGILASASKSAIEERDASREIRRRLDVIMPRRTKRTVVTSFATWRRQRVTISICRSTQGL
uniref:Putative secreted protein n=1 Tax=Ixodes ricinus TaxID=34613 RepID=A0A6B0U8P9_IXORI